MIESWLIAPAALLPDDGRALGLIDLATWPRDLIAPMPAYPLIGLGDAVHPFAARLDALIEPPVSAGALIRQVLAAPRAAATLVQSLRATEGLEPAAALAIESMAYAMLQGSAEHAAWLGSRGPGVASPPGTVTMTRRGDTLHLTLRRPWTNNAIDRGMRDALHEGFTLAALDPTIARIRLTGEGPAFSVGADLAEFGTTRDPATAHLLRARTLPAWALARRPGLLEAHVNGACVGAGLEIAAFARRLTAGPRAWFQLPELAMGIIPGAGGCVSVPARIGRRRAALMMLSGRRIDARTALRWGLIDAIVDPAPGDEDGADMI